MGVLTSIRDIGENFRIAANNSVRTVFTNAPELPALPEPPMLPASLRIPDISELRARLPKLPGMERVGELPELPEVSERILGAAPFGPRGVSKSMALAVERPLLQRRRNMAMMV